MSVDENKRILSGAYEAVSRGDPGPLAEALADDIVWTIIGSTALSGTSRGRDAVRQNIFARLRARLADGPIRFEIERLIGEDDWVVMLANGFATAKDGRPYNNVYAITASFSGGKIVEMRDYVDTALIDAVLGR